MSTSLRTTVRENKIPLSSIGHSESEHAWPGSSIRFPQNDDALIFSRKQHLEGQAVTCESANVVCSEKSKSASAFDLF